MANSSRPLLMAGEKMQAAIYPLVLPLLAGFERVERIDAEYLHLQYRDGEVVPCTFGPKASQEAGKRIGPLLEVIGDGIADGAFFARSAGSVYPDGHCKYCDFLPICGKDRAQREERKAGDPAVRSFARMAEIDEAIETED